MIEVSIVDIAVGVFFGNVMAMTVFFCMKQFDRPDDQTHEIPGWTFVAFILVVGLSGLVVFGQHLETQAAAHSLSSSQ